ncbi:MAG: hypothetical protein BGO89_07155 [Candidatus Kapaibacterium thiocyanatum]|uniref:Uncharacterized protein n=1 Tax=Candidatus Kapaibacterium thiocyanatum TaxID=1895771 RepID=A0A1M3KZ14_9BACT|nr:MAG: hypothetical protein BGO89_07155 ['Candidatus Kapabacteria' thiocyanatum]
MLQHGNAIDVRILHRDNLWPALSMKPACLPDSIAVIRDRTILLPNIADRRMSPSRIIIGVVAVVTGITVMVWLLVTALDLISMPSTLAVVAGVLMIALVLAFLARGIVYISRRTARRIDRNGLRDSDRIH